MKSVVFSPNTGKYGPEKTPYLDTFHAVLVCWICFKNNFNTGKDRCGVAQHFLIKCTD